MQVGDHVWYYEAGEPPVLATVRVVHTATEIDLEWIEDDLYLELPSVVHRRDLVQVRDPEFHYCVPVDLNDRDEQPPLPAMECDIRCFVTARELPELEPDSVSHPITFAPDTIERFEGADGRPMRIVALAGAFWQQEVR